MRLAASTATAIGAPASSNHVALNGGVVTSEGKTKAPKLANLDKIDAISNTERTRHVRQIRAYLTRSVACAKSGYYARNMRPSRAYPGLAAMDERIDKSLACLGETGATMRRSPERAARAVRRMRQPLSLGGGGFTSHSKLCSAEWTSSVATTWAAAVKTCLPLASIDITTSTLPFFREFRHYYSQLLEKRNDVADYHEQRNAANGSYFDFDGVEHEPYKPKGLPPPSALPTDISNFMVKDDTQKSKPPAQRSLCKILYHEEWWKLYHARRPCARRTCRAPCRSSRPAATMLGSTRAAPTSRGGNRGIR